MLNIIQLLWLIQSSFVCSMLALEIDVGDAADIFRKVNWTSRDRLCPDPGRILHGSRKPDVKYGALYPYGTPLHFSCNLNFKLVNGNGKIVCGLNGEWEPPKLPSCRPVICKPPAIPYGYIATSYTEFYPKTRMEVFCRDGYRLQNKFVNMLECQNDGAWIGHNGDFTQELPECVESTCPPLPEVRHATLLYGGERGGDHGFKEGTLAQYSCHQGYLINGTMKESKFIESHCHNSEWNGSKHFECKLVGCSPPPLIANGKREVPFEEGNLIKRLKGVSYPVGIEVNYRCNAGYLLMASTHIYTCMPDGSWLPSQAPTCEKLDVEIPDYSPMCPKPPSLQFGYVLDVRDTYYPSSTVNYVCHGGFRLSGPSQLQCDIDGHWQPSTIPSCELVLDKPMFAWGSFDRTRPSNREPVNNDLTIESESQTFSLVTAGCVLGILSIILILAVAYQRRRCKNRFNHVQLQQPLNSSASGEPNTHLSQYQDQDRVSLIAFADGAHLTLPTYEESTRQRNPVSFGISSSNSNSSTNRTSGRYSRFAVHRPCNHDQASIGLSRQSSSMSHSMYGRSSSVADSLGSNDTVTPSEVSTTVTVDTLSSNASHTASTASTQPFCGSLASFDTTGSGSVLNVEGVPLLEEGDAEKDQVMTVENQSRHHEVM